MCIYIRLDVLQSYVAKYEDLGMQWIYFLFISIFYSGLVAIPTEPATPALQEHLYPNLDF